MKMRIVRENRKPSWGPWVPRQSCGQVGGGTSEPPGATPLKLKQSFLFLLNRNCIRESVASGPLTPLPLGFFLKSPLLLSRLLTLLQTLTRHHRVLGTGRKFKGTAWKGRLQVSRKMSCLALDR